MHDWTEISRKAVDAAAGWTEAQIAANLWRFVFDVEPGEPAWLDFSGLRSLGGRIHPHVLGIMRNDALRARLMGPSTHVLPLGEVTPLSRLCRIIENDPPAEVIGPLAPFLESVIETTRSAAAKTVAATGREDAIPLVEKFFLLR